MGGGPLPAQGGIQILGNAEAGAPLWFATSLSSHTAWWFASAFSCATETARTVQTVQKTSDFTGAGVMVQTVQKTVVSLRSCSDVREVPQINSSMNFFECV